VFLGTVFGLAVVLDRERCGFETTIELRFGRVGVNTSITGMNGFLVLTCVYSSLEFSLRDLKSLHILFV
jgi:hypothetical protein